MLTEQGSMTRYQHQLSAVPLAESFVLIYNYMLSRIQSFDYVCHDCGENNCNSIPNGRTVGRLVYKLII